MHACTTACLMPPAADNPPPPCPPLLGRPCCCQRQAPTVKRGHAAHRPKVGQQLLLLLLNGSPAARQGRRMGVDLSPGRVGGGTPPLIARLWWRRAQETGLSWAWVGLGGAPRHLPAAGGQRMLSPDGGFLHPSSRASHVPASPPPHLPASPPPLKQALTCCSMGWPRARHLPPS